ncbi:MAG: hypothetical protein K0U34_07105 [Alphaproteobacteria bacterium]|nr:hypothetical protein [Alphaproteobacteria bacterium]
MRSIAAFSSLLALGLLVGGILTLAARAPATTNAVASSGHGAIGLDFRSMLIGLMIGLVLSNLTRVPWGELPRRAVAWVLHHERNLYRAALAAMFVGVLLFY